MTFLNEKKIYMSVSWKECAANSVAAVYCAYTCCRFQVPQFQGTFQTHISEALKLLTQTYH